MLFLSEVQLVKSNKYRMMRIFTFGHGLILHKSAIFDQEAKIVFMDIRFACRHLCVCVVGYVTKWGICPSGLYLNYSISCPRRPDLIEVARGVWSSQTSLGTSGERSISNNLSENIAISATYITSWLLKGLGLSVWVPRAQQWSEVRSGIDFCVT